MFNQPKSDTDGIFEDFFTPYPSGSDELQSDLASSFALPAGKDLHTLQQNPNLGYSNGLDYEGALSYASSSYTAGDHGPLDPSASYQSQASSSSCSAIASSSQLAHNNVISTVRNPNAAAVSSSSCENALATTSSQSFYSDIDIPSSSCAYSQVQAAYTDSNVSSDRTNVQNTFATSSAAYSRPSTIVSNVASRSIDGNNTFRMSPASSHVASTASRSNGNNAFASATPSTSTSTLVASTNVGSACATTGDGQQLQLQMVNGQLVVQAQLQQIQTPTGMVMMAVVPQNLVHTLSGLQMAGGASHASASSPQVTAVQKGTIERDAPSLLVQPHTVQPNSAQQKKKARLLKPRPKQTMAARAPRVIATPPLIRQSVSPNISLTSTIPSQQTSTSHDVDQQVRQLNERITHLKNSGLHHIDPHQYQSTLHALEAEIKQLLAASFLMKRNTSVQASASDVSHNAKTSQSGKIVEINGQKYLMVLKNEQIPPVQSISQPTVSGVSSDTSRPPAQTRQTTMSYAGETATHSLSSGQPELSFHHRQFATDQLTSRCEDDYEPQGGPWLAQTQKELRHWPQHSANVRVTPTSDWSDTLFGAPSIAPKGTSTAVPTPVQRNYAPPVEINPEEEERKRLEKARLESSSRLKRLEETDVRALDNADAYKRAFINKHDAVARLLPFHLFDEPNVTDDFLHKVDAQLVDCMASQLRDQKLLENRFRSLLWKEATAANPASEECLVSYILKSYEDELLTKEKEAAVDNIESFVKNSPFVGNKYTDLQLPSTSEQDESLLSKMEPAATAGQVEPPFKKMDSKPLSNPLSSPMPVAMTNPSTLLPIKKSVVTPKKMVKSVTVTKSKDFDELKSAQKPVSTEKLIKTPLAVTPVISEKALCGKGAQSLSQSRLEMPHRTSSLTDTRTQRITDNGTKLQKSPRKGSTESHNSELSKISERNRPELSLRLAPAPKDSKSPENSQALTKLRGSSANLTPTKIDAQKVIDIVKNSDNSPVVSKNKKAAVVETKVHDRNTTEPLNAPATEEVQQLLVRPPIKISIINDAKRDVDKKRRSKQLLQKAKDSKHKRKKHEKRDRHRSEADSIVLPVDAKSESEPIRKLERIKLTLRTSSLSVQSSQQLSMTKQLLPVQPLKICLKRKLGKDWERANSDSKTSQSSPSYRDDRSLSLDQSSSEKLGHLPNHQKSPESAKPVTPTDPDVNRAVKIPRIRIKLGSREGEILPLPSQSAASSLETSLTPENGKLRTVVGKLRHGSQMGLESSDSSADEAEERSASTFHSLLNPQNIRLPVVLLERLPDDVSPAKETSATLCHPQPCGLEDEFSDEFPLSPVPGLDRALDLLSKVDNDNDNDSQSLC